MNLISILWIAAGLVALILAADGLVLRFLPRMRAQAIHGHRLVGFSAVMLALGIGCIILGIYEASA